MTVIFFLKYICKYINLQPIIRCSYHNTMNIVNTHQGKLRGLVKNLPNGETCTYFKGIPYAKPPIGKLRFLAPLPPEPWTGIRDSIEHGSICPQYDLVSGNIIESEENCLFLNVYTKTLISKNKLSPVMFWVHGGGYMSGSGNSDMFGPEYLLQHNNVVIVTINYRLEVLGFLCLDNEQVPGNAGLKDQAAALRWVKKNIAQFGGDPDNVTLFGESAGATSVALYTVSPLTRGLFHKVIAQSGVPNCDWAYSTNGKERAFRLGKLLGKETENPDELLQFLQSVPTTKLIKSTFKTMTPDEKIRGLPLHFAPVVEKQFKNIEGFLTDDFLTLLRNDKIEHVPMMLGYNTAEGLLTVSNTLKKKEFINKNFECKIPREIFKQVPKSKSHEFGERIKQFYFKGEDISEERLNDICKMETDLLFTYNIHRFADDYSKKNKNPIFVYIFDLVTELNLVKMSTGLSELVEGACHADDLFYLFSNRALFETVESDARLKNHIYTITKLWTNFAKMGNPTPDSSLGVTWPPYDWNEKNVLCITDTLKIDRPDQCSIEFWKKMYAEAGCVTPDSRL